MSRGTARGTIYLKLVNVSGAAQPVDIDIQSAAGIADEATRVVLSSADPKDTNTIRQPTKIVPVTSKIKGIGPKFTHSLPPYSVTVLQIEGR